MTLPLSAASRPALLNYAVVPDVLPVSAAGSNPTLADLMIAVTNLTGASVPLVELVFQVPAALATNLGGIAATAVDGTPWDISNQDGTFTATPHAGVHGLAARASLGFVLGGLALATTPGPTRVQVWETTSASGWTECVVMLAQASLAITRFEASAVSVSPGGSTTLTWTSTGGVTATLWAEGASTGVALSGSTSVSPKTTTVYSLVARTAGPEA